MGPLQSLQFFYDDWRYQSEPKILEADRCIAVKNYVKYLEFKNSEDWPADPCSKDFNAYVGENKFVNYYFKDLSDSSDLRAYLLCKIVFNNLDSNEDVEFYNGSVVDKSIIPHNDGQAEESQVEESIDAYSDFEFKEMNDFCDTLDFNENVLVKEKVKVENILQGLRSVLEGFQNIVSVRKPKPMYVLPYYTKGLEEAVENKDYDKFKSVIDEMVKNKIFIDSTYYNPIVSMYFKKGDIKAIHDVLKDMKSIGVQPGIDWCGYMLELYSNALPERPERGIIDLLHSFQNEGMVPNLFVCNKLIKLFVMRKNTPCAFEVFEFMKKMKIKPDCLTYACMIHLNALVKNYQNAHDLYKKMKSDGIVPNRYVYNSVLTALINQPNADAAFEILKEMSAKGIYTNAWNYQALHDLFVKEHEWDQASEVLLEKEKMELQPGEKKNHHSVLRTKQRGDKAAAPVL